MFGSYKQVVGALGHVVESIQVVLGAYTEEGSKRQEKGARFYGLVGTGSYTELQLGFNGNYTFEVPSLDCSLVVVSGERGVEVRGDGVCEPGTSDRGLGLCFFAGVSSGAD